MTTGHDGDERRPTGRRGILGWMLFDWAAQPFFTVITTFVFGPYLVSRMAADPTTACRASAAPSPTRTPAVSAP